MWLSLLPPALVWWLSVYVKVKIFVAVCIVEFTGLHSKFFVCNVCNVFTVFLYFLQNESGTTTAAIFFVLFFVKTIDFCFSQCSLVGSALLTPGCLALSYQK